MTKKYVEIIFPAKDGKFTDSKGIVNRRYFPGTHFELFDKLPQDRPAHWVLNSPKSKKQSLLLFDIDQIVADTDPNRTKSPLDCFDKKWIIPIAQTFKLKPEFCGLNWTGFGFHLYAFFEKDFFIEKEADWIMVLREEVNSVLKEYKLVLDSKIAMPCQTIRVPGSQYLKFSGGKTIGPYPTKVLKRPTKQADWIEYKKGFDSLIKNKGKSEKTEKSKKSDLKNIYKDYEIDWGTIIGSKDPKMGCRFLKTMYNNQEDVNYDEWLAMMSLTSKYNDDERQSLEYSKQYSVQSSKYNEKEFYDKFIQARYKMNPFTCRKIKKVWRKGEKKGGCTDCPHYYLNMPLRIKMYSSQDTGFRLQSPTGPKNIDYKGLCDYLNIEKNVAVESDETFYIYNKEAFWEPISFNEIASRFKSLVQPQIKPSELSGLEKFLKHHSVFNIKREKSKSKHKIFLKNCILDLRNFNMEEAESPKYKNFYRMDFDYDSTAKCPLYIELLDRVFKNKPLDREYFLKYMAMALLGDYFYDKAMVLVGDGSNGKSSIINGVQQLFSNNSNLFISFSPDQLKKDETHHHYLRKARVAYLSDSDGRIISKDRNLFKMLISGEQFSYRLKYSRSLVHYNCNAKFVIGMNDIPILNEGSEGIKRRFDFLLFENKIWLPDIDKDYAKKIKDERPGILNLLIENLKKWQKDKIFPEISKKVLDTAIVLGDVKQAFWENDISITGDKTDLLDIYYLYTRFKQFIADESINNKYVVTRRMFLEWILRKKVALDARLSHGEGKNRHTIYGVRLKNGLSENQPDTGTLPPF